MKFCRTDAQSIFSQIKRQEKQIKLKRRWLMGILPSKSEKKKLKKSKIFQNMFLPESLLREDDIFYESVRTHVEAAFGAHGVERENPVSQDHMHMVHIPNRKLRRLILACLDNLTTKGIYLLAMILTGGSVKSGITRCNLKKIIKGSLSSVLDRSHTSHQLETRKQLFQLLSSPQHFRDRCEPLSALKSQSYHAVVAKVLHGLKSLPSHTLVAMHRKLRGEKTPKPQLQPRRHGWGRDRLINLMKKTIKEMLVQIDRGNELQEPLAKAMAVADLSQKLTTGCHGIFSEEFYQFSPEVKSLQNDIMNAIWSVENVLTLPMLRNLQRLIEPEAIISTRSLRMAFVNFLTEFLFECSDMDSIPKSLSQIIHIINKHSNSKKDVIFEKKYIEEEVDCILSVSAQAKQIVLDLLPDHEFDQGFTDAYMEQLEESEDSGSDEDDDDNQPQEDRQFMNGTLNLMDSNCEAESVGDFAPFQSHHSTFVTQENVMFCPLTTSGRLDSDSEKLQPENCDAVNLVSEVHNTPHNMIANQTQGESKEHFSTHTDSKSSNSSAVSLDRESDEHVVKRHDFYESDTKIDSREADKLFHAKTGPIPTRDRVCNNHYLAIQDSCDKTSMLAYNLIGHVMKEFVIIEGRDLNLSRNLYLSGDNQVEDVKETRKRSSSGKHKRGSAIVGVIKELVPSFPDSGTEKLKTLMGL